MTVLPDTVRRQLRQGIAAQGSFPPELVDPIVDIAVHAAESAFATLQRVALETHPDRRVGVSALGPALSLLGLIIESGMTSLKATAAAQNLPCGQFKIGTGA